MENLQSPITRLKDDLFDRAGVELSIKRDDMLHPFISGNKWRKLKYNLQQAKEEGVTRLLTFGGAYSNHIAAVAAAGKEFGFDTIGMIRGEEVLPLNPTLDFATKQGMKLGYLSRELYTYKNEPAVIEKLREKWNDFYLIPEGGANILGVKGCEEILSKETNEYEFIAVASGTGTTAGGILKAAKEYQTVLSFPVLKGGAFLEEEIEKMADLFSARLWMITKYHFGGYAKVDETLVNFINEFKQTHQIPLDPIYTGKMMFGLYDMIEKNVFPQGSKILAIHTGGLQGIAGMNERLKNKGLIIN